MSAALEPTPTRLDERVLRATPIVSGARLVDIVRSLNRRSAWYTPDVDPDEVRLILRGWEHLGRVECRGGWWRRVR